MLRRTEFACHIAAMTRIGCGVSVPSATGSAGDAARSGTNRSIAMSLSHSASRRIVRGLSVALVAAGLAALEEKGPEIAGLIRGFMRERVR